MFVEHSVQVTRCRRPERQHGRNRFRVCTSERALNKYKMATRRAIIVEEVMKAAEAAKVGLYIKRLPASISQDVSLVFGLEPAREQL